MLFSVVVAMADLKNTKEENGEKKNLKANHDEIQHYKEVSIQSPLRPVSRSRALHQPSHAELAPPLLPFPPSGRT